eukprot:TRINITY_DN22512_c0_g1_i1.p1 TRINITY_DN22512_c0_g1~~TRINITY_DN22512_c0_g1_i1.p1  ORF type:complete len:336 (-),score=29.40 TRINITY_DN22512_c0_g1_i1:228-1235(-)
MPHPRRCATYRVLCMHHQVRCLMSLLTIYATCMRTVSSINLTQQSRAMYDHTVGVCAEPRLRQTGYCRKVGKVRGPRHMVSGNRSLAPMLYDEYHRMRGDGVDEAGRADKASQALVEHIAELFPPSRFPSVLEGGPGNCWLLRQLVKLGYAVQGQEVSSVAIDSYCHGLDVRQGFLQKTSFRTGSAALVLALDVMEHLPELDLAMALREVRRLSTGFFIFNVAPCAKYCFSSWFCSDRTIHPTGLCDDFPRRWWNQHLREAGFVEASPALYTAFEMRMLDYVPVLQTMRNSDPGLPHGVQCYGRDSLKCITPWNHRGHYWFIFTPKNLQTSVRPH